MKSFRTYIALAIGLALGLAFITAPLATAQVVLCSALAISAVDLIASGLRGSPVLGVINTSAVSNTIQAYYSKKLLGHAVQATRLVEFAQLEDLPAGQGNSSVRFYRPPAADLTATGAPAALTEGTAPTNFRDISYTAVDISLAQLGQVAKVTDVANTVGLIKYLDTAIELMGEEFALDVDTRIRNILSHASTGSTKRYAQGAANFAALAAASLTNGSILPRDLLDALTALKIARAPKVNGVYVAIAPPQVTRDILNHADFREVVRQNNADRIFKGEVGDFYGCRIVEGTNAFQEDETEGTFATTFSAAGSNTTGLIYNTIVTGKGAYGAVNMKKMGAASLQNRPQIIVVDKPDSGNPLAQYIICGWKAYWAGANLNSAWSIALRTKSNYA